MQIHLKYHNDDYPIWLRPISFEFFGENKLPIPLHTIKLLFDTEASSLTETELSSTLNKLAFGTAAEDLEPDIQFSRPEKNFLNQFFFYGLGPKPPGELQLISAYKTFLLERRGARLTKDNHIYSQYRRITRILQVADELLYKKSGVRILPQLKEWADWTQNVQNSKSKATDGNVDGSTRDAMQHSDNVKNGTASRPKRRLKRSKSSVS